MLSRPGTSGRTKDVSDGRKSMAPGAPLPLRITRSRSPLLLFRPFEGAAEYLQDLHPLAPAFRLGNELIHPLNGVLATCFERSPQFFADFTERFWAHHGRA